MQALKDPKMFRIDRNLDMPSVPIVLSKILQLVDDNRASARRLEELILHDPSLSARMLKLANSAFYSFRSEVRTISHAITLLGLNLVKSLAIGVSIFDSFTKGIRDESGNINRLWMHSFGVGLIAQEIWTKRRTRVEGEFALLCGLLHDLGKIVFFKKDPVGYSQIFTRIRDGKELDICADEMNHYGIDHANLGSTVSRQWGLPPDLSVVVRQHHSAVVTNPLVAAVTLADILAKQNSIGYDGDGSMPTNIQTLMQLLQMDEQEYEMQCVLAKSRRADAEEFFQLTC